MPSKVAAFDFGVLFTCQPISATLTRKEKPWALLRTYSRLSDEN